MPLYNGAVTEPDPLSKRAARWLRLAIALAVLVALSPALYYWGTAWVRGPIAIEVEEVYPIGNKGTLEARVAFPDGDVHRVLNRDQPILFWKIDSERVDNQLSTARRAGTRVEAWFSGVYLPWLGNQSLFNHLNVLAVDPLLPPGVLPAAFYALASLVLWIALRRALRRIGAGARRLLGRDAAHPVDP